MSISTQTCVEDIDGSYIDHLKQLNGSSVQQKVDQKVTPECFHSQVDQSDNTPYFQEGNYNGKTLSTEFEFLQDNGKDESDIGSNDVAFLTRVNGKPGMVVDGQLEGSPISWKIDTGAGRTFITEESYRHILPDNRPLLRQIETKFETANGSCLNVLGTAVMTLSFDEFCVDFPIIVGGVKSNLLGEDFIKCFPCHWDWNTSSFEINGKNIPFQKNGVDNRSSRVIALEIFMVPAKHEVVVKSGLTRKVGDTS